MTAFEIPTEGVEDGGVSLLVAGGAVLAALFLFLALRRLSARPSLAGPLLGATSMVLAIGAGLYVHDAVALPELVGMLTIGGGVGYLMARQVRSVALATLSVLLVGLGGIAILLVGGAARMDPEALGITAFGRVCLIVTMLLGAGIVTGAAAAMVHKSPGLRLLLAGATGWAGAAFGFAFGNPALILCGGLLGAAGTTLGLRSCRTDHLH